jgi:hypothetical protein
MSTPSTLTQHVAHEVIADHTAAARRSRSMRLESRRHRFRRRGASRTLWPRGRIVPPFAH